MPIESPETNFRFPAIKVGISAGIAAALTLASLVALLWFGRFVIDNAQQTAQLEKEAARNRADAKVGPEFRKQLQVYVDAVTAEHEAARAGRKAFDAARLKAEDAERELSASAKTPGEVSLYLESTPSSVVYPSCVDTALPGGSYGYRSGSVADCEKQNPIEKVKDVLSHAEVKH